jgi:hypothetical protein
MQSFTEAIMKIAKIIFSNVQSGRSNHDTTNRSIAIISPGHRNWPATRRTGNRESKSITINTKIC